jgi:heat shock protein beta
VFIRELISNSADALDKIRFESLSDASVLSTSDKDLEIRVEYDSVAKSISFEDNGVGMTKEDLRENLGTVAKSGTTQFIEAIKNGNLNLIGQFGVGFYSSFLAANKVQVWSKHNSDD